MLAALLIYLLLAAAPPTDGPQYLIYLHGQIVEGSDGRPVHPQFGVYDYPALVDAFGDAGFTVISEVRPAGTDGFAYSDRVAGQVDSLLALGVASSRISVVGMSKGGGIAIAVSSKLANPELNFVFLGTCTQGAPPLILRGRILSIYESSDETAGSCTESLATSELLPIFRELRISTGRGHGAFYEPDPVWMEPLVAWCLDSDAERAEQVESMYRDYRSDFASAAEVSPDSLAAWVSASSPVLVDVRKSGEREVSFIPGSITREEYEDGDFTGRRIVAYCTIGYRSGKYTEKLRSRGIDAYNLEAGILGWVHSFRPVERDGNQVRQVHVYGKQWSLLPEWYEPVW